MLRCGASRAPMAPWPSNPMPISSSPGCPVRPRAGPPGRGAGSFSGRQRDLRGGLRSPGGNGRW
eukprot:7879050-Pyramimonas_sp.AAC.1